MQATGVDSLERTIQKTNEWLKAIQEELDWGDRHRAYVALRATLHALRNRLSPDEALQLGAQLPILVRGVYYENWRPADTPVRMRTREEFLDAVAAETGWAVSEPEPMVKAVFVVLTQRVSPGEIEDVKRGLPEPIRALWPT